jgi:ABC-2 type transport system permease protein
MMFSMRKIWVMFLARNREFFRDRSAFGWNFLFPFLIVVGFGIIFGGKDQAQYKVGLVPWNAETLALSKVHIPEGFRHTRYLQFIGFASLDEGQQRLKHHKIDFLLHVGGPPYRYWVSQSSPNGYVTEKMFLASLAGGQTAPLAQKENIQGEPIRYIDWLFPGILGMNMMFSSLWGVGYVVVRYRKNGVLKRLQATPLTAFEYLCAQMLSRIFLLMFSLVIVWIGCDFIFHFRVHGSYLVLFLVFFVGGLCLCALGLILAARGTSEEFTSGVLNFISWPMMFLSEVWFSLEGAPHWVQVVAQAFPLTHLLVAARKVINDGAGLSAVAPQLGILAAMTLGALLIAACLFSWDR